MPVRFLNPVGLWLLALAIPLVALYLLKVRRQRLEVASTWLWSAARRDLLARHPFRRFLPQVPLLLQLAALGLLALASARPSSRSSADTSTHVALVIDTSASMAAKTASGRTRLEAARDAAKSMLGALSPGTEAFVVTAGKEPTVVAPADRDTFRLTRAIDKISVEHASGDIDRAVALAVEQVRARSGRGRVVVLTDSAYAPARSTPPGLELHVVRIGKPIGNTAVVRLDVRRARAAGRDQVQVFALVANFSTGKRDVFVTLRQRNVNEPLASRRLALGPGERAPAVLSFEPARGDAGTGLLVELSPPDVLALDDRGFSTVPESNRLPVVLAPRKASPWLARAVSADPEVELLRASFDELAQGQIPRRALVIVDGACPNLDVGGDWLVVDPPAGGCRHAEVGKTVSKLAMTSWSDRDARFDYLTLDDVFVEEGRALHPESESEALARAGDAVLIADISEASRTATLVGFDVGRSNWPLKASFVLFVRNVMERARRHQQFGVTGPVAAGEPIRLSLPRDVKQLDVEGPAERHFIAHAEQGLGVLPPLLESGFYHVSWAGAEPGSVLIAANLLDPVESDLLHPEGEPTSATGLGPVATTTPDPTFEYTWVAALLALVALCVDVIWLTRRPRHFHPGRAPPERPQPPRAETRTRKAA